MAIGPEETTSAAPEPTADSTEIRPGARPPAGNGSQRSTGPRTLSGKARSSKNALKHGIFSSELLIPGIDSPKDERSLRKLRHSYIEYYRAEGGPEIHQIEIALGFLIRYKRLLRAEAGEILIHGELLTLGGENKEPGPGGTDNGVARGREVAQRRASIPNQYAADRLQKYENHLLRGYYRALSPLERNRQRRQEHEI